MSDTLLITQTLQGNTGAFGDLMEKHRDRLCDMAGRILGNSVEAEDVVQESFIEAYRHLGSFQNRSKFSTWIYSIVLNRVRNRLRHQKVLKWSSLDAPVSEEESDYTPQIAERGISLEASTGIRMDMEKLRAAVKDLPTAYQSIFTLHYFQNLSLEEIAQELSRPLGTVKVYLHRARKLLQLNIPGLVRA